MQARWIHQRTDGLRWVLARGRRVAGGRGLLCAGCLQRSIDRAQGSRRRDGLGQLGQRQQAGFPLGHRLPIARSPGRRCCAASSAAGRCPVHTRRPARSGFAQQRRRRLSLRWSVSRHALHGDVPGPDIIRTFHGTSGHLVPCGSRPIKRRTWLSARIQPSGNHRRPTGVEFKVHSTSSGGPADMSGLQGLRFGGRGPVH